MYLKERNNTLGGRKVELIVGRHRRRAGAAAHQDAGAGRARTTSMCMIGPLAAFEALATDDYIRQAAAADALGRGRRGHDAAQAESLVRARHLDLGAVRAPAGRLLRQELKYKRMVADRRRHRLRPRDVRAASSACSRSRRQDRAEAVPAADGARLRHLSWRSSRPTSTRIFLGFAGSNGFRFLRQFNEYGLHGKVAAGRRHDRARRRRCCATWATRRSASSPSCWYSAELDNPINQKFAPAFRKECKYDPGFYAAGDLHRRRGARGRAARRVKGKIEDKQAFMKALRDDQGRHLPRPGAVRRVRQRGRQRLHPQGGAQGRPAGQRGHQDLPERQPVLDLRPEGVPGQPGVFARLAAGQEPRSPDSRRGPSRAVHSSMQFWVIQTLNSLALGGLLFLLASGFSLIFGLMRIANLTHGALFMLGAYLGATRPRSAGCRTCGWRRCSAGWPWRVLGGLLERLRPAPAGAATRWAQVLVTLGVAFIIADAVPGGLGRRPDPGRRRRPSCRRRCACWASLSRPTAWWSWSSPSWSALGSVSAAWSAPGWAR